MEEHKIVIELGAGLESVIHRMISEYFCGRSESLGENIQKAFGINFSEIVHDALLEKCNCSNCNRSVRKLKLILE